MAAFFDEKKGLVDKDPSQIKSLDKTWLSSFFPTGHLTQFEANNPTKHWDSDSQDIFHI